MACFIRINAEDGARHYVNLDLVEDVVEHVASALGLRFQISGEPQGGEMPWCIRQHTPA